MTRRLQVTLLRAALGLFAASSFVTAAAANQTDPGSPPPAPPVAPPEVPLAVPSPMIVAPAALVASTDHDMVVGKWGVEVRRLDALRRFPARCADPNQSPCDQRIDLNAFSLRRWTSQHYAYSFGLALAAGGGKEREAKQTKSLDTYFGIGPTVGASFLLANWQHMAVSAGPQLDLVYFMPSGSGPKAVDLFLRGLVEAELHLGFIGLPAASVGVLTGLEAELRILTDAGSLPDTTRTVEWSVGTRGPTSLWGVVTNAFMRFYF